MKIRTVTGDVPADKIGRTLTHEHLLYTYPGGEYDHNSAFRIDDAVDRIARELKDGMDRWGYATIVDMTPCEVGRHPDLMKRVAEQTGCNVIAVTGSLPVYDARFERALRVGGRLFVVVGTGPLLEALRVVRVGAEEWARESLFETGMPPLAHAAEPPKFVF